MTLKNYDALFELDADDYRTSLATSDGKTGKTSMRMDKYEFNEPECHHSV